MQRIRIRLSPICICGIKINMIVPLNKTIIYGTYNNTALWLCCFFFCAVSSVSTETTEEIIIIFEARAHKTKRKQEKNIWPKTKWVTGDHKTLTFGGQDAYFVVVVILPWLFVSHHMHRHLCALLCFFFFSVSVDSLSVSLVHTNKHCNTHLLHRNFISIGFGFSSSLMWN